jgi:hypothetical protein
VSTPQATDLAAPLPTEPGGLHRPVRAMVALTELVVAGLAVWGAFWAWPQGFATISTVVTDGVVLDSQRVSGNWLATAILFGTVAAVLVLDALRQTVLAVRARPRKVKRGKDSGADAGTESDDESGTESDAESDGESGGDSDAVSDAKVTGDD